MSNPFENFDLPGAEEYDLIQEFIAEADGYNYETVNGYECLVEAIECLESMMKVPPKIECNAKRVNPWAILNAVLSLVSPIVKCNSFEKKEICDVLTGCLTKAELAEAFSWGATVCNEHYRLRWIVEQQGGWKDARDGE